MSLFRLDPEPSPAWRSKQYRDNVEIKSPLHGSRIYARNSAIKPIKGDPSAKNVFKEKARQEAEVSPTRTAREESSAARKQERLKCYKNYYQQSLIRPAAAP